MKSFHEALTHSENLTFFRDLRKLKVGPLNGLLAANGVGSGKQNPQKTYLRILKKKLNFGGLRILTFMVGFNINIRPIKNSTKKQKQPSKATLLSNFIYVSP